MGAAALADVAPQVVNLDAAGLAWWNVRQSRDGHARCAHQLWLAYQRDSIRATMHARSIRMIVQRLRAAGIEPVLIKGWALARQYPDPGLRPYADIDLVVPPGLRARADVVVHWGSSASCIDRPDVLDAATWAASDWDGDGPRGDLTDHPWEAVLERSCLVPLEDLNVRVLGAEDHLRLVAVHAVRHRFVRPVWLCDIGLLMETLPRDFDWTYCLAGRRSNTERLLRSLGLAHHLLGAYLLDCPPQAVDVPAWLIASVLRQWGSPLETGPGPSIVSALLHPRTLPGDLYRRWPNPLESTLRFGLPLMGDTRWPVQACDFAWRGLARILRLRQQAGTRASGAVHPRSIGRGRAPL
jgi:hypothetical protein